ncbi:MAG: class I SAM-dependent methyltransferase [Pseudomonadota bacterium]|nr:class I SAM-dependent methyltransferase [Pseudomonadota bacterium]
MRNFSYVLIAILAFFAGSEFSKPLRDFVGTSQKNERQIVTHDRRIGYQLKNEFEANGAIYPITVLPGVFGPREAQQVVLPLLNNHPDVYKNKTVLEIGAGSGINAVYMALSGAAKVVATDINPDAIANIQLNAENLGVTDIVDARLTPLSDISAYSVINPDERFDLIISNPPYHLDLDTTENTPTNDTGDLGLSIVRGFESHLNSNGLSLLFYNSLFYHEVMVKHAKYKGYDVSNHFPTGLSNWEAQSLFNNYLNRLLVRENLPPEAFNFKRGEDGLQNRYLRNLRIDVNAFEYPPLIQDSEDQTFYPGWISIKNK